MTGDAPVVLFDEQTLASPYRAYERLRATGPVHHEPSLDLFFVVDHGAILEVLENPAVYSSNLVAILQRGVSGVSMESSVVSAGTDVLAIADPPVHTAQRKLVQPTFGRREVQHLRDVIDREVSGRTEAFVAAGGGDFMSAVASPVPVRVVSSVLGLPSEDAARLVEWSDRAVELLSGVAGEDRMAVLWEATGQFMTYLGARLDDAGIGLIADIRTAVEEGQLTRDEAVNMLMQLVAAGTESTTSLLGSAFRALAADAALQQQLRTEPELVANFVEETLRLESPFRGHFRVATAATTLGGTAIPAGGRLMLLWGAANRDPRQYDTPAALDLDRHAITGHLGFGRGIHFCVGAHLARLEARVAIDRLLACSAHFELAEDHEDRYRPSLLIRRLEQVLLSVTPAG
jgi:cytochrome P450